MSDINVGTLYDVNKNLMLQEKELSENKLRKALDKVSVFLYSKENMYYMLLCKEKSDYTIFHLAMNNLPSCKYLVSVDLKECLQNRGNILSIEATKDGMAYEIWLKIDNEAFCYYLFPYDLGIIEVNKIEENYWNGKPI